MDFVYAIAKTADAGPNTGAKRAISLGTHWELTDCEQCPRAGVAHGNIERPADGQTHLRRFDVCHWFASQNLLADRSLGRVNRYRQRTNPARGYRRSSFSTIRTRSSV